jgi:hypothetical protein
MATEEENPLGAEAFRGDHPAQGVAAEPHAPVATRNDRDVPERLIVKTD